MDLSLLPECYVDTCLIETLVPPETHYNHQKGTGTVGKKMRENFSDRFALGIIDKDKKQLHYLNEFNLIAAKNNLELYKHKQKHHYFIVINPAIERFILDNAYNTAVSLDDFDLPTTLDELRKVSKSVSSKNDSRFKALFRSIISVGTEEFTVLANLITYLKEYNYKAEVKKLKEICSV